MRQKAQIVKDRLQGPGSFGLPRWGLTGKNSIVEPGHEIVLRLLPRWDVGQKYLRGEGGKTVINPKYQDGVIYFEAIEHWWDSADGSHPVREWCPKSFGVEEACPICEAWQELKTSQSEDDKTYAKRIRPQEVYLFNAVVGDAGKRQLNEQGLVDIRYIPAPGTVFLSIINIMTGGENESFARGDISDPREGYDLKLSRPSAQGDRWKVDSAPQASGLYVESEKAVFQGWIGRLINLSKMMEEEVMSYEELYKAFHGTEAPPIEETSAGPQAGTETPPGGGGAPPVDPFSDLGVPGEEIDLPGKASPPVTRPSGRSAAPKGRSGARGRR